MHKPERIAKGEKREARVNAKRPDGFIVWSDAHSVHKLGCLIRKTKATNQIFVYENSCAEIIVGYVETSGVGSDFGLRVCENGFEI